MRTTKKILAALSLSLMACYSLNVYAELDQHVVVAPKCLTHYLTAPYQTLAKTNSLMLIKVTGAGIDQLIQGKTHKRPLCGGFMDVSRAWHEFNGHHVAQVKNARLFLNNYAKTNKKAIAAQTPSYDINYPTEVNQLLKQINPQLMWHNLEVLSSMKDRYANSDNGVAAANWFKQQIENIARDNNRNDVTVTMIATGSKYKQPSVLVKVGNSSLPGVVIGAHMDTLNSRFEKKPGADDDGSGSVTVLETARTIIASGKMFKKPIYFVWYAAEEEGLVGSDHVVSEFEKKKIPVSEVLHFDLTGYAYSNEPTMWLMDDYVNKALVAYLEKLILSYVGKPVKHSQCGYACSDHASWYQAGYTVAMPAEAAYEDSNPYMHSAQDTTDKLSLSHMTDYLKLATAFVVEMAGPVT